jgi:hypothetical protein
MRFRYSVQGVIAADMTNRAGASNPVRTLASGSINILPREQSAT